jgi:hypothetical protein
MTISFLDLSWVPLAWPAVVVVVLTTPAAVRSVRNATRSKPTASLAGTTISAASDPSMQ